MSDQEPFELPAHWCWACFADVAAVRSNLVDPKSYPDAIHIAPNHIESWSGELLPFRTVREDQVTSPKHRFKPGQILYSKIRPYLAKATLARFEGLCSADMYPIESKIDARFLLRWMLTRYFTDEASLSQGRTVLPKINQDALATLRVPVAPLNEQHRIVAKLDAIFERTRATRERVERLPSLLDKLKRSILAAAFRGDLTKDWRAANPNVEPASVLLERIRVERRRCWEENIRSKGKDPKKAKYEDPAPIDASDLPELPEGWVWSVAEEVVQPGAEIVYGIVQPGPVVPDGIPYVRGLDIENGIIKVDQLQRTSPEIARRYERAALEGGDILLGIIRATKVAVVPAELEGANITQGTARFRPSSAIRSAFLARWLEGPWAQAWLHDHYRGIDMPGLNLADVRRLPVPIPTLGEQQAIEVQLRDALSLAVALEKKISSAHNELSTLERSSLQQAFAGLLVAQDPSDEPASSLLDRVRASQAKESSSGPKRARNRSAILSEQA